MIATIVNVALSAALVLSGNSKVDVGKQVVKPLSKEWSPLVMITGFHSVSHKKYGLSVRVLEADGSASVAQNPVSLFVVATNGRTSDLKEHVWRLPRGVVRVKRVTLSVCGVDIAAEVDEEFGEQATESGGGALLKACFIDDKGNLESDLTLK